VWPGIVVAPDNLKVQISALRKALGGSRDFIRTEFGRGYRFTAVVRRTTTADPGFFSTPDATETPAGWKGIPPIELSAIAARVASLERKLAEALELLNGRSDSDAADLLRHHRCSGFSSGANRQHMFSKRAKPGNMSLFTRNG
jgi:hypothetical protein